MKRVVLMCMLVGSTVVAQEPQQLSLEDAIRIGKENSKSLRISELKVDAASAKSSEANAAMLPSLKFEGNYKRLSNIDPFVLQFPPIIPAPGVVISPNIPNTYSLKLGLQQPLFTGFKLRSNARAAEHLVEASDADRKGSESDLVLTIVSAYWMLYQAIETKKFVDENVDRLTSYQSDTQNLMKAGLVTRNDLLKIQVQLSNAKLGQIDAANDVEVATMNLNNLMGQALDMPLHLISEPDITMGQQSKSGDASAGTPTPILVDLALKNRPDLLGMNYRVEAARSSVAAVQGNWWPQLGLIANYFYSRPNQRFLPMKDEFKGTWEVGVVMQFDIWNWGTTAHQMEQASSQLHQTEYLLAQMKDNAALEVRRYQLGVERATKRIDVAREAIEQAEENSRSTNEKYKNGLATSTDLLDASLAVLQARTSYTGALVEHQIALARLNKAVGS
jgi:outer membrane protein TolC